MHLVTLQKLKAFGSLGDIRDKRRKRKSATDRERQK